MKAIQHSRARIAAIAVALFTASGCSLAPQPRALDAEYDFGPVSAATLPAPRLREPVLVADVTAPGWLDSPALVYRLAYQTPASPRAYSNSRWVAPPAALLTARLRERVAAASLAGVVAPGDNVRADVVLRVELVEFAQSFASAQSAEVRVQLRASVVRDQRLLAQRPFTAQRAAPTPDAAGAAGALTLASDALLDEIVAWTAATIGK